MFSIRELFLEPVEAKDHPCPWLARVSAGALALAVTALVFYFSFHQLSYRWNWAAVYRYR